MAGGSCLCGDVAWEASGSFEHMLHCHCSICRKAHGAPFATFVCTSADGFRYLRGEESVEHYASSAQSRRPFCRRCGSVTTTPLGDRVFMAAGCLDDDPGARPEAHIFAASKAVWYTIEDDQPQFDDYPPGWDTPPIEPRPSEGSSDGVVRGSCLCGGVAWEADEPISRIVFCHCRRCRKARSAAHTANTFCDASQFRWLRGEDLVTLYEVPEAERFAAAFCRICGSPQPRTSPTRVTIPAASIDGDPGQRPAVHIFVPFKAEWYEIPGSLPQYEAYATDV